MRKRVFDVACGSVIFIVITPVILVIAALSWIAFRSNPFFVHDRVGRHGRSFRFIKVRSLPPETPEYLSKDRLKKIKNSSWGRFIRAHHLDELPQVWHVLTGRMSLVGPRPEMPELDGALDARHRELRHSVLPGCTGLWQISNASAGMIKDAPEFDMYYVDNWTLRLDIWILVRTAKTLLGGRLIESLEVVPFRVSRPSGRLL